MHRHSGPAVALALLVALLPAVAAAQPKVHGDVYGGGALANVDKSTVVAIKGGTVMGSVYGGGLGDSTAYGGTQNVAAIVGGDATVHIGDLSDTIPLADGISFNTVRIVGNVFGANNLNGTPRGSTMVHIWNTAHTADNVLPASMSMEEVKTYHDTANFALREVYGGGNKADYKPGTTDQKAQVYVHGCYNTVKMLYGGGRAAAVGTTDVNSETSVTVEGGRIDTLFAGGDGHTVVDGNYVPADVYGNTRAEVMGGYYTAVFGGSNTSGTITGTKNVAIDHTMCDFEIIGGLYGGGNLAYGGGGTLTIECGAGEFDEVYGGSNLAGIDGDVTLNIHGGTIVNVYGGSRGSSTVAADIKGNVSLNLYGGTIGNAFGGSNINGNITGTITVLVDSTEAAPCQLTVQNVYGASNLAQYRPDDSTATTPQVQLLCGTVGNNVFGGGKGAASSVYAGLCTSNPKVEMHPKSGATFHVGNNIYGGGELASVGKYSFSADSTTVSGHTSGGKTSIEISGGSVGPKNLRMPDFKGHVFGGGKGIVDDTATEAGRYVQALAFVHSTDVAISGSALVCGSVYGGSENGHVWDSTCVRISGGQIGLGEGETAAYEDSDFSKPELAKCASWTYDPTKNEPYDMYAGDANYSAYDGSSTPVANAIDGQVKATDGHTFYGNVFGGGSGYFPYAPGRWLKSAGSVGGNARVEITGGHILSSVYGGNELTDVGCGKDGLTVSADKGICRVTMTAGTVGVPRTDPAAFPSISNLYGGGKGDQRIFFNKWTNVASTEVKISGTARIFGSVFGGGEDGHVLADAKTTIDGEDVVIGTSGASGVDGNVFGGGRGFSATALTAGVVCGNVDLDIANGYIMGSVYGGGRLAAVGPALRWVSESGYGDMQNGASHGVINIRIGTAADAASTKVIIGNEASMNTYQDELVAHKKSIGDVFGGSKGWFNEAASTATRSRQALGISKRTTVEIDGGGTQVLGNVYGGGEIASVGQYVYDSDNQVSGTTSGADSDAGLATITIQGGYIGRPGGEIDFDHDIATAGKREPGKSLADRGHVYGAGLGMVGALHSGFTFVTNTDVAIGGTAMVYGSVFGGGENGHVLQDTKVTIKDNSQVGMEIYDDTTYATETLSVVDADGDTTDYEVFSIPLGSGHHEDNGEGTQIFFGNVYGGGRGVDKIVGMDGDDAISETAGRVRGNTHVYIEGGRVTHNVYGGGSLASVGLADSANSGLATVVVSGGIVGFDNGVAFDTLTGEYTTGTDAQIKEFYLKAGRNEGRVYGSGRGQAGKMHSKITNMAFVKNSQVTIKGKARVRGSVFGGGENGHVRRHTSVHIQSGQIGVPLVGAPYADGSKLLSPSDTTENPAGVGPTIYRGNVYGGGRGLARYTDTEGNHFSTTAGRVYGNANVYITGGRIWHHVYGGGSLASVGDTVDDFDGDVALDILDSRIEGTTPGGYWYGQYMFDQSDGTGTYDPVERPYRVGDPITGTGLITVRMVGGTLGRTGKNEGRIYGSGRGIAGAATEQYRHLAFGHNTHVFVGDSAAAGTGADIRGCVFGGGANGHVTQNSLVEIEGGIIGTRLTPFERSLNTSTGAPNKHIYRGNVYGGGRGVDPIGNTTHLSNTAGRVFGNSKVVVTGGIIRHSVYGGGSLASVGSFELDTVNKTEYYANPDNVIADVKHLYYTGTGQATVLIDKKAHVGPDWDDLLYGSDGNKLTADTPEGNDAICANYLCLGVNEGSVYGSGRGVNYDANVAATRDYIEMAFTHNTYVAVSGGNVLGSVFGGGENGHVRQNTHVIVSDSAIVGGLPLHGAGSLLLPDGTTTVTFADTTMDGGNVTSYGGNELAEDVHGVGMTVYRGNVYGGGRGVDHEGTAATAGYSSTAGRVHGNTEVEVTGGTVYRAVFGGGSVASVGNYTMDGDTPLRMLKIIDIKETGDGSGYEAYGDSIPTGTAKVTISGKAVVGQTGFNEGHVYGGGRGIAAVGNTANVTHLAYCYNTNVIIKEKAEVRGSVFGGGANGHVMTDTDVKISGGTIGTRLSLAERTVSNGVGRRIYRGNVYGGGRGVDPDPDNAQTRLSTTAGRVYGNTNVTITGGTVRHNVYGGGSLASVGSYQMVDNSLQVITNDLNYYDDNTEGYATHAYLMGTGVANVTVKGGRIGPLPDDLLKKADGSTGYPQDSINDNFAQLGANEGQVYGSGRGVAFTPDDHNSIYSEMAFVKETHVAIDSVALVCGSVFGGGENGHVRFNTDVQINGGLIGGIPLHDNHHGFNLKRSKFAPDLADDVIVRFNLDGVDSGSMEYKNRVELYEMPTGVGRTMYRGNVYGGGRGIDHTGLELSESGYSSSAGRVYGNANITITGGHILHHVYGGGSIASVGNYEYVKDDDGKATTTPDSTRAAKYGFEYRTPAAMAANDLTDTMQHPKSGTVTVKVYGGVIGITGINEGRIYCAGRGIAGSKTAQISHLAYCDSTYLLIDKTATSRPDIRGSVFGGGANGHVLHGTKVDVFSGDIGWGIKEGLYSGGVWQTVADTFNLVNYDLATDMKQYRADTLGTAQTMYRGNVYGGGRGVDPATGTEGTEESQLSLTAGRVYGNTDVHVGGDARVLHNVYGGGSLASVGDTLACTSCEEYYYDNGVKTSLGNFGTWKPGTGRAAVLVDGEAQIGWNGVDNNGQVYGSCRGMPASVGTTMGSQYIRLAYVHDTRVTVEGSALVLGSVFGGGANGHVKDSTFVVIGGNCKVGVDVSSMEQSSITRHYDYCGNVYGAGRGVDRTGGKVSMTAGYVRGNTRVLINGGEIRHNVYGGGSMALVGDYGLVGESDTVRTSGTGTATVLVSSSVGTSGGRAKGYGGNVFGSSRGRANSPSDPNDYSDMAYVFRSDVQLLASDAVVYGNIYGGGENGHVDFGGTQVTVLEGTVEGSVFGGGKGSLSSPTAGVVDGSAHVSIGSADQESNSVVIRGNVYGGNDANSSPLDSSVVHIWKTAHTTGVNDTSATGITPTSYAIANVFGGGNLASTLTLTDVEADSKTYGRIQHFEPTSVSYVHIHNCDNTVYRVFGGGNAADVPGTGIIVDGGRFRYVFCGGNGEESAANVGLKGVQADIRGGVVDNLFGGSNKNGVIEGPISVQLEESTPENLTSPCSYLVKNFFGGSNEAFGGGGDITVGCGANFEDFYGGSNLATIGSPDNPTNITLTILGGTFGRVFGGSKGSSAKPADIYGDVTLNIYGGTIGSAFGGNNINGNIHGHIEVNVDWANNHCPEDTVIDYVFGAGNVAAYDPDTTHTVSPYYSPVVNIIQATVGEAVLGGGFGTTEVDDTVSVTGNAAVTASPVVVIGAPRFVDSLRSPLAAVEDNNHVRIGRSDGSGMVFGGGANSPTEGSTTVVVRGANTMVRGNVYGGGNAAEVEGSTDVHIGHYADGTVEAPSITLADGKVALACTTPHAMLHYSIGLPDASGSVVFGKEQLYSGPFAVPAGATVKARATHGGMQPSGFTSWTNE